MKKTQQSKKATHANMDDLIRSISADEINSGQIECDSLEGKLVEAAGKTVGMVTEDNKKTLLIRRADDCGNEIRLLEKAMYFDKTLIANAYWIKFRDTKLPIHSLEARGDIRDFFDL